MSLSLSLRNFSRHALELVAAHDSDLTLQQEINKRMNISSPYDMISGVNPVILGFEYKKAVVNATRWGKIMPESWPKKTTRKN